MVAAELFKQRVRPLALATAGVVNWTGNFVIAMAFPPIQASDVGSFSVTIKSMKSCEKNHESNKTVT
jgi:hypothetical protein